MRDDDLATALRSAASDPNAEAAFLTVLMNATVFVLGKHDEGASVDGVLLPGSHVHIQSWQDANSQSFIPFFSSLEVLQHQIEEPREYLALPAKALFEITIGQRLILYAGGGYGKEFLPGEVAALLAADGETST